MVGIQCNRVAEAGCEALGSLGAHGPRARAVTPGPAPSVGRRGGVGPDAFGRSLHDRVSHRQHAGQVKEEESPTPLYLARRPSPPCPPRRSLFPPPKKGGGQEGVV